MRRFSIGKVVSYTHHFPRDSLETLVCKKTVVNSHRELKHRGYTPDRLQISFHRDIIYVFI